LGTTLTRFGPLTPTRARRLFDASVDQTEARNATVGSPRDDRVVLILLDVL
jgi:hypothetical protein